MKKILCLAFILLLGVMGFSQEFTRELKLQDKRMNGQDVKLLQEKLLSFGFSEVGGADGWFGPKTEEAVKKCQLCFGFKPDGVVKKDFFTVVHKTDTLTDALKNAIKRANAVNVKLKHLSTAECETGRDDSVKFYYKYNKIQKVEVHGRSQEGVHRIDLYPFDNGEKLLTYSYVYLGFETYHEGTFFLTKDKIYSIKEGQFTEEKLVDSLKWYIDILQVVNLDYLLK